MKTSSNKPGWKAISSSSTAAAETLWNTLAAPFAALVQDTAEKFRAATASAAEAMQSIAAAHPRSIAEGIIRHFVPSSDAEILISLAYGTVPVATLRARAAKKALAPSATPAEPKAAAKPKRKKRRAKKKARRLANQLSYKDHVLRILAHLKSLKRGDKVNAPALTVTLGGADAGVNSTLVGIALTKDIGGLRKQKRSGKGVPKRAVEYVVTEKLRLLRKSYRK